MRLDLTKLPTGEMLVGFLLAVLAVTFTGAFVATSGKDGSSSEPAAAPASPSPGGGTPAAGTPTPGGGDGGAVTLEISMGDNFFELNGEKNPNIKLKAGQSVTIHLTNNGTAIHNQRFAGEDNQYNNADDAVSDPQLVTGGGTATLKFSAPEKTGTYNYQCDFHPTDMKGTITVE